MKRIVIAGADGFLGQALAAKLSDHEVWTIGRRTGATAPGVHRIITDLATAPCPIDLPPTADAVIYLAQSRRYRDFPGGSGDMVAINIQAPLALADWARRAACPTFIYLSTGSLYAPASTPLTESHPVGIGEGPLAFYGASKWACEQLLAPFAAMMTVVIMRPFSIYGAGQSKDMLVPRLIDRVRRGEPIQLASADGLRFNPIHVNDAAQAIVAALSLSRSTLVNLAGPRTITLREFVTDIGFRLGRQPILDIDNSAPPPWLVADITLQSNLLGPPSILPQQGVRLTLEPG